MSQHDNALAAIAVTGVMEEKFRNQMFDWLSYETVCNKLKFRKTNQSRPLGFYILDLGSMQVWVRDYLSDKVLQILTEAFCPDSTIEDVRAISVSLWSWKPRKSGPQSVLSSQALAARVVMPYNYWDNDERAEGLGTDSTKPNNQAGDKSQVGPPRQLGIEPENPWFLWKTASRSSVMQIGRVIKKNAANVDCPIDQWMVWPWKPLIKDWRNNLKFEKGAYRPKGDGGQNEREFFGNQKNDSDPAQKYKFVNPDFLEEVCGNKFFSLSSRTAQHFSVKTGVCWVGFSDQKSAHKDIIGDWIIGGLRSDFVAEVDYGPLQASTWARYGELLLQTELFVIVEKLSGRCDNALKNGQDGVAVRDLSVLRPDRVYIPPLSIPMLGKDNQTLVEEFSLVEDETWGDFWKQNYAEALGRAKALFLLRYGLQHGNPNVQNYLLEFEQRNGSLVGPSRVLIRDLQDAALHREVIWALYGEPTQLPPAEDRNSGNLRQAYQKLKGGIRLDCLSYQFAEDGERDLQAEETGSTNPMFGPPGTQLGWFRFSTFFSAQKRPDDLAPEKQDPILRRMLDWGVAHAVAYVRTIEECLGVNLWDVDWTDLRSPDRYRGKSSGQLSELFRKGGYAAAESGALKLTRQAIASVSSQKIRAMAKKKGGNYPEYEQEIAALDKMLDQMYFQTEFKGKDDRTGKISSYADEPKPLVTLANSPLYEAKFVNLSDRAQEAVIRFVLKAQNLGEDASVIAQNLKEAASALASKGMAPESPLPSAPLKSEAKVTTTTTMARPPQKTQKEKQDSWQKAITEWMEGGLFAEVVASVQKQRKQLLALTKKDTVDEAIRAWFEDIYKSAYAQLDNKYGFSLWDDLVVIQLWGSGFTDSTQVKVEGYNCEVLFCENPNSMYCGFKKSDGLSDDSRSNALKIKVIQGDNSVTLLPKLEGDLPWEENIAAAVHQYLKGAEGQQKIRDYRDRKWEPAQEKFRIRVVDWQNTAMPGWQVLIKLDNHVYRVPTNRNGEILFFGDAPLEKYTFPEMGFQQNSVKLVWRGLSKKIDSTTYTNAANQNVTYTLYRDGIPEERNLDPQGTDTIVDGSREMEVQVKSHGEKKVKVIPGQTSLLPGDKDHFGEGVGFEIQCSYLASMYPKKPLKLMWKGLSTTLGKTTYTNVANENLKYTLYRNGIPEERNLDPQGTDTIVDGSREMEVQVKSHGEKKVKVIPGQTSLLPGDKDHFGEGVGFEVKCEFVA